MAKGGVMTEIEEIVKQAIDLHLHIGPEIIPRRYTAASLAQQEKGRLSGAVLKNHFVSTISAAYEFSKPQLELYGGIVLNQSVGGLNSDAIRAAAQLSDKPIVVWLPTISASNFLNQSDYEIPPEWVNNPKFQARPAASIQGISLLNSDGALTVQATEVLRTVKDCGAVLATGHISAAETMAVATFAKQIGIRSVIITHPIYQRTKLTISQQKQVARLGCFLEQCFSMISIDNIDITEMTKQIQAIGPGSIVLSSDVGQLFSPSPSQALQQFAKLLVEQGIPLQWIRTMLVTNPRQVLELAKDPQ